MWSLIQCTLPRGGGHQGFSLTYPPTHTYLNKSIIGRAKRAPHGRYIWDFSYIIIYYRTYVGVCVTPLFFFFGVRCAQYKVHAQCSFAALAPHMPCMLLVISIYQSKQQSRMTARHTKGVCVLLHACTIRMYVHTYIQWNLSIVQKTNILIREVPFN